MKPDWKDLAGRLARSAPLERLDPAVVEWIRNEGAGAGVWAVACSGGGDSLFLLLYLYGRFEGRRDAMRVLHFDHRLRGEASVADADFTREVAAELGVGFCHGEWKREPGSPVNEASARAARFAFFKEAMSGRSQAALFLGQQMEDILETQLMRLARGSGSTGLAAPRPLTRWDDGSVCLRPLLGITGREIRELLNECGAPFRDDASNRENIFLRNRMRLSVVPPLREAVAPADAVAGAALARRVLEEEDAALTAWLRELLPPARAGAALRGAFLNGKPRGIWRRALEEWMTVEGLRSSLSRSAVESILDTWMDGKPGRFSAGSGVWIATAAGEVRRETISPGTGVPLEPWPLIPDATVFLPGGRALHCSLVPADSEVRRRVAARDVDPRREAFLSGIEGESLGFRQWRDGDRFRPLGAPGGRKLQDWFTDRGVPREERRRLPVVFSKSGGILWIPGLPPAESRRIVSGTKLAVWLTYRKPEPA